MDTLKTPLILDETRNGLTVYSIDDDMLRNRQVSLMGEINEDSVNSLIKQLLYLERKEPGKEILLYINSPGGEVGNGLVLYDVMNSISSPIRTICTGLAASMAAVIFSSGDRRELYKHSRVMIHDPSITGAFSRKALELQSLSDELMGIRESIAEILSKNTGKSVKAIYKMTGTDTYFDAKGAIEFGLADSIIGEETETKKKGGSK